MLVRGRDLDDNGTTYSVAVRCKMKGLLAVLMFAMLLTGQAFASTYYIAASGGSDSNPGTTGSRWATYAHAFSVMHGGDTLIVGNGVYTEDITLNGQTSLNGSSGAYTTIQAENTWGATIDGSATTPAYKSSLYIYGMAYVQVIGIKFASGVSLTGGQQPVVVNSSDHIKLIKLAGYNAPCNNNTDVFDISQDTYTLVEDSHAWGCGRYKFLAYEDQNVIFRHNVARHDSSEVSGGVIGTWGRQNAQFTMYDSTNILMQNNILIDSGETDASTGNLYGGIWSENNASVDNSGKYEGNIFINLKTGTSSCCFFGASINDQKLIGTREMRDNAIINSTAGIWTDRTDTTGTTSSLLIHHITSVNITGNSPNTANEADGAGMMDVSNVNYSQEIGEDSILQQDNSYGVGGWLTSDYNIFYSNTANFGASASGHTPSAGAHDLINTNPGLLYPVRVESGTPGYGTASDGGNRGATILYRIGTPGTVWGETGYDTLTATSLWPWADEAVIKSDMASYTGQGASGTRGFAAAGTGLYGGPITLTSYIWESLGHACPSGICSSTPTGSTPTFSPAGGAYSSTQNVTLATSSGTVICYNTTGAPATNGTTGCTTGTHYTTPVSVAASETLYAVAGGIGLADSPIGSAAYTISTTTATPTFTPAAGTYYSTQTVTISDSTPSSTIHYTIDGSTPTTGSTTYTTPLSVASTETIKAMATASGYTNSAVGSAAYTINLALCSGMSLGNNASLNGFVPFPGGTAWNTDISASPLDPNNTAITSAAGFTGLHLHHDWSSVAGGNYGIPYAVVDSSTQAFVPITVNLYASESDLSYAPYPLSAPIEGAPADCSASAGDQHVMILDRATCQLYETYNTQRCSGAYSADQETVWNMNTYEQRPWSWTSVDAAGLSVFAGLVRYDEVAAGAINHALRFTVQNTRSDNNGGYFVPPASHAAGTSSSVTNIMGMRIRLKASVDISSFSAANQVILTAMKKYGMILADNGGNFFFQGAPDSRWNDSDLSNLDSISSSNFEVIQTVPTYPGYDLSTAPTGAAPTINSFTTSASTITLGAPVTLTWSTTNDSYDFIDKLGGVNGSSITLSPTATATYTLNATNQYGRSTRGVTVTVGGTPVAATPVFSPVAGTYSSTQTVTISDATPSSTIYYTTNGSTPTTGSAVYSTPLTVSSTETVKGLATASGYTNSAIGSAVYT